VTEAVLESLFWSAPEDTEKKRAQNAVLSKQAKLVYDIMAGGKRAQKQSTVPFQRHTTTPLCWWSESVACAFVFDQDAHNHLM
jgi:hypothetical protein